jgi:fumarate reductase subunit C
LELGVRSQEPGEKRKKEEGRSQKKCFYKYEMLPKEEAIKSIVSALNNVLTVLAVAIVTAFPSVYLALSTEPIVVLCISFEIGI